MKRVVIVIIPVLLSTAWGSYNSPIGPATVPPSSIRNELVPSPNPINTNSNLVVTGNVSGGKHFRGSVPYQAPTYFTGTLGSSSLDSFLRWSAGPGEYGGSYQGIYAPYYSPSRMVSGTRAAEAGNLRSPMMQTRRYIGDMADSYPLTEQNATGLQSVAGQNLRSLGIMGLSSAADQEASKGTSIYSSYSRFLTPRATTSYIASFSRGTLDTDAARESQRLSPLRESLAIRPQTQDLRQKLEAESLRIESPQTLQNLQQIPQGQQRQNDLEFKSEQAATERRAGQLRFENEGRSKEDTVGPESVSIQTDQDYGLNAQPGQKKETLGSYARGQRAADKKDVVSGTAASENKLGVLSGMQTGLNNLGAYGGGLQQGSLLRTGTNDRAFLPGDSLYQANPEADKNKAIIRSGQAIEGSGSRLQFFGDIASHSAKRANENFAEAEKYVKQGKYYQAADSYGLAAIYSENNAIVFAAKSHALFAAGQYMSSSLFLSRALASLKGQQSEAASEKPQNGTFIDCSIFRSNLGLIERDTVENRIADIEKLSLETNASELQFLLGYVYYQIGRVEKAQDAIRKAYEKNPESDAIVTLKGIIERSLSESGPAKKP